MCGCVRDLQRLCQESGSCQRFLGLLRVKVVVMIIPRGNCSFVQINENLAITASILEDCGYRLFMGHQYYLKTYPLNKNHLLEKNGCPGSESRTKVQRKIKVH